MKKSILWTFGLTTMLSQSVLAAETRAPFIIEGDAATEIIEKFPWKIIFPGEGGNSYSFISAQSGDPVLYCAESIGSVPTCKIFAEVESKTAEDVYLYAPDYDWCNENSFFYKLAHHNPGNGQGCIASFDYGKVSGYTWGHWHGIIKIKFK